MTKFRFFLSIFLLKFFMTLARRLATGDTYAVFVTSRMRTETRASSASVYGSSVTRQAQGILLLRRCYTMQLVLQLISQWIYFENSSCMVRDVTLCNVSCNLSRNRFWCWVELETIFKWRVFIGCSTKTLRDKLHEGCYTVQWRKNVLQRCGNRCEK